MAFRRAGFQIGNKPRRTPTRQPDLNEMKTNEPINDGGPAFPVTYEHDDARAEFHGMSLRDYFAAKALGLFSLEDEHIKRLEAGDKPNHAIVAKFCYGLADAMMEARK